MPEFAPGIPNKKVTHDFPKVERPKIFEFALHDHKSEGAAKQHFDLRLGDPDTGHAHSWAMKYWPKPGEIRLAVMQPTHTLGYMDFHGRIEQGYGKGDVALARREKAEIVSSSKGHVRFNLYSGKNNEEYLLRHTDNNQWLLKNITTTRDRTDLPSSKPPYKSVDPDKLVLDDPKTVLQAKIDGAHVLYNFKDRGSTPDIFSYRPTERATGVIEHTHRVPGVLEQRTPSAIRNTILRGELYAVDPRGRALESHRVGGILNANVWKSREKQQTEGKLVPVVFDVVKWKGKDVSSAPYSEKKQMLEQAVLAAPWLKLPRTATSEKEKKKLLEDVKKGKEPSTREGVIEWHLDKPLPKKSKFRDEHDVTIRGIFQEESKRGLAGGVTYSMTKNGPIIGRVGTGFSHALKKDLADNPDKYIGLQAKVHMTPGHLGRAPSFAGFHLDQDLPETAKLAGAVKKIVSFQGLTIKVDRPKGFVMKGKDSSGKEWTRIYRHDYGFFPKTDGGDGEELDVFIGPKADAKDVFWVIQNKPDGSFDEYKTLVGFPDRKSAKEAYAAHVPLKFFGGMIGMPIEMMKSLLGKKPETKTGSLMRRT